MACPVCHRPVTQPKTGRPRIYCSDNHRLVHFRRTHPLGWKLVTDQPDVLEMLRARGVTSA